MIRSSLVFPRCGMIKMMASSSSSSFSLLHHQSSFRNNHTINRPSANSLLFDDTENFDQHHPAAVSSSSQNSSSPYHHYPSSSPASSISSSTPVQAYTGQAFADHATRILADAAKKNGFTSPYWLTSRIVRTKNIGLKEGTLPPTQVCLEGNGIPKVYNAYFIDDIHPEDAALFLSDVPQAIPENAWLAGTVSSFLSSPSGSSNKQRYHPKGHYHHNNGQNNSNNNKRQFSKPNNNALNNNNPGGATMTPIVYVLYKERWRCPGNTSCAQKLCRWVHHRRNNNHPYNQQHQGGAASPFPVSGSARTFAAASSSNNLHQLGGGVVGEIFPPVFLHEDYVTKTANMRLLKDEPQLIEDSTITMFYNADRTTLPPHSVVPVC